MASQRDMVDGRPQRGRPRSKVADEAILAAALSEFSENGFAAGSIAGVAARSGVGKPTIYRRYRDKTELFAAALGEVGKDLVEPIDTGSTRDDLVEVAGKVAAAGEAVSPITGALLLESASQPELMSRFREQVIEPRREQVRAVLRRGIERGVLEPSLDMDLFIDALMGAFIACLLRRGRVDPDWPERIVGALLGRT